MAKKRRRIFVMQTPHSECEDNLFSMDWLANTKANYFLNYPNVSSSFYYSLFIARFVDSFFHLFFREKKFAALPQSHSLISFLLFFFIHRIIFISSTTSSNSIIEWMDEWKTIKKRRQQSIREWSKLWGGFTQTPLYLIMNLIYRLLILNGNC